MCLAVPMRIVDRRELEGVVELDGVRRAVCLALCPDAELGDQVLVHAGYALTIVDPDEAAETLSWLREQARLEARLEQAPSLEAQPPRVPS